MSVVLATFDAAGAARPAVETAPAGRGLRVALPTSTTSGH